MPSPRAEIPPQITPEGLSRFIWSPYNRRNASEKLRQAGVPAYQIRMIEAIKEIGFRVAGPSGAFAEPDDVRFKGKDITLDKVLSMFSPLARALKEGVVDKDTLANGLGKRHTVGDSDGFIDTTCLLPQSLALPHDVTDESVSVAYGNRIPILGMDLYDITHEADLSYYQQARTKLWTRLASYMKLVTKENETVDSAEELLKLNALSPASSVLIPFSYSQNIYDFQITNPGLFTDRNNLLHGSLIIQAAVLWQGPSPIGHPPRTLMVYGVDRIWSRRSKQVIDEMADHLIQSTTTAIRTAQDAAKELPFVGGRTGGN